MTKKVDLGNVPTAQEIVDNLIYSPYYPIACRMIEEREIDDPTIADVFEAFHEIAKIDNKINRKENKNENY